MHCKWSEGSLVCELNGLERDMVLAEKKVRPLVVLTRTTFCRASAIERSRKGHDSIVNSAPFVVDIRQFPPILLRRIKEHSRNGKGM